MINYEIKKMYMNNINKGPLRAEVRKTMFKWETLILP